MHDRVQAAALFRERVGGQKLIEGWVEGPCAEAADLRGINRLMTDFFDDPPFVRDLFEFVVAMELRFAEAQVAAGRGFDRRRRRRRLAGRPAKFTRSSSGPTSRSWSTACTRWARACGCTSAATSAASSPASAAWAARWSTSTRWSRWSRHDAKWARNAVLAGNLDPVKTLRNGTPQSVTAAIAECHRQAGAAIHRRRRLRGAARYARGQRRGAA